jgi:hypothetical protein
MENCMFKEAHGKEGKKNLPNTLMLPINVLVMKLPPCCKALLSNLSTNQCSLGFWGGIKFCTVKYQTVLK